MGLCRKVTRAGFDKLDGFAKSLAIYTANFRPVPENLWSAPYANSRKLPVRMIGGLFIINCECQLAVCGDRDAHRLAVVHNNGLLDIKRLLLLTGKLQHLQQTGSDVRRDVHFNHFTCLGVAQFFDFITYGRANSELPTGIGGNARKAICSEEIE